MRSNSSSAALGGPERGSRARESASRESARATHPGHACHPAPSSLAATGRRPRSAPRTHRRAAGSRIPSRSAPRARRGARGGPDPLDRRGGGGYARPCPRLQARASPRTPPTSHRAVRRQRPPQGPWRPDRSEASSLSAILGRYWNAAVLGSKRWTPICVGSGHPCAPCEGAQMRRPPSGCHGRSHQSAPPRPRESRNPASRPGSCSDHWSRHSDLNRGPAVYETAALPLSYVGAQLSIREPFGISDRRLLADAGSDLWSRHGSTLISPARLARPPRRATKPNWARRMTKANSSGRSAGRDHMADRM